MMCLLRISESAAVSLVIIMSDVYRAADKIKTCEFKPVKFNLYNTDLNVVGTVE